MNKRKIVGKLRDGQKVLGRLQTYNDEFALLEEENGTLIQLTMFKDLNNAIEDGYYGNEIIEISRLGNEYEIYMLDDWPAPGEGK